MAQVSIRQLDLLRLTAAAWQIIIEKDGGISLEALEELESALNELDS